MDSNLTPVPGISPVQPGPASQGRTTHPRTAGAAPHQAADGSGALGTAGRSATDATAAVSQQQQQLAQAEQARLAALAQLDQLRQAIASGAYVIDLGPLAQKLLAGGHLNLTSGGDTGPAGGSSPSGQGGGA